MPKICYGHSRPNVTVLPNYGPCNLLADSISLCCETGHYCLTNGLCMTHSGEFYSGGCTDSEYEAAICPTFCTSGKHCAVDLSLITLTFVTGDDHWVNQCLGFAGTAVGDGDFCCSVDGTEVTCCNTASNGLGLKPAVFSALAVSARVVPADGPSSTSSTSGEDRIFLIYVRPRLTYSRSIGTLTSTSVPTTSSSSSDQASKKEAIDSAIVWLSVVIGIIFIHFLCCFFKRAGIIAWIKRQIQVGRVRRSQRRFARRNARRGSETNGIPLDTLRERSDGSGPPVPSTGGSTPAEVDGPQVGLSGMDANGTQVVPDSNPLENPALQPTLDWIMAQHGQDQNPE